MKPRSLLILMAFLGNHAVAQDFAPVGATWTYGEGYAFSGITDYSVVTVTKDTVINGMNCMEIDAADFCQYPKYLQYVNTRNDSVFIYDQNLDEFRLIYAFHAPPGASWSIPITGWDGYIDTIIVTVDSLSTTMINSHELTVQHVTYYCLDYNEIGLNNSFYYNSVIVDILGDLYFLFYVPIDLNFICDYNYPEGLRCYDDNYFGHYETGIVPYCDYISVGIHELNVNTLGLYPNPTSQDIYLTSVPLNIKSIELIDNLGRTIRFFSSPTEIHLDGLNDGIYFLRIINDKHEFYLEKVIKCGS